MQENSSLVPANGIELCYDTFGDRTAPPLLLIMGLAAQMIAWDEAFCEQLAARGYFVIRFDNRDIGLSTKFPQYGTPDLMALLGQALMGKPIAAPYTLRDMAADARRPARCPRTSSARTWSARRWAGRSARRWRSTTVRACSR